MVVIMSYISFKDVRKEYIMGEVTIKAVDGVNFHIEKGNLPLLWDHPEREKPRF